MANISEAAKLKACELANAFDHSVRWTYNDLTESPALAAFARYIQQVSVAAKEADRLLCGENAHNHGNFRRDHLAPLILPEPVDPLLIEARKFMVNYRGPPLDYEKSDEGFGRGEYDESNEMRFLRAALKRGMELAK